MNDATSALLETTDLAAGYDNATIVQGVSLAVDPGEIVGILGPNGAGKSTVMKTIIGIADRHDGTIRFQGEDLTGLAIHERATRGIGYLPQQNAIFPEFTVEENLSLAGHAGAGTGHDFGTVYDLFPRLEELASRQAAVLSGGERKMLALGCAAITDPDLYLLDEPSDGLAPNLAIDVFDRIETLSSAGKAILINEQKAQVLDYLDRAYVLQGGRIVEQADAQTLREEERLEETYLRSNA